MSYFADSTLLFTLSSERIMTNGCKRRAYKGINHYNAEIFLYKPWRPKGFCHALVSSFCFIWCYFMLWVNGHYNFFSFSALTEKVGSRAERVKYNYRLLLVLMTNSTSCRHVPRSRLLILHIASWFWQCSPWIVIINSNNINKQEFGFKSELNYAAAARLIAYQRRARVEYTSYACAKNGSFGTGILMHIWTSHGWLKTTCDNWMKNVLYTMHGWS